jgi:glycosyltransferase involved in cell wall biosynthesis
MRSSNPALADYDDEGGVQKLSKPIADAAQAIITCSPLQALEMLNYWQEDYTNKLIAVPPLVDTEIFHDNHPDVDPSEPSGQFQQRDIKYLYVGAINWHKGLEGVIENYVPLTVVGYGDLPANINRANYLGKLDQALMPDLYRNTETFVHHPLWKEAFGRTVVEAALCGCTLDYNNNVGATSYDVDWSDPKNQELGAAKFAQAMELI